MAWQRCFTMAKPEPRSAQFSRSRLVDPIEPFKQSAVMFRLNSDAGVGHLDHGLCAIFLATNGDCSPCGSVFDRVVDQIAKNLQQSLLRQPEQQWGLSFA